VRVLECGELAAVVKTVPLAEFGAEPLQARLRDPAWLEAMVRGHNEVVASIASSQAILPAKFGCVYARAEDLMSALEQAHGALVDQLARVEGSDEWGIHLYADRATIQQRLLAERPSLRQLQETLTDARPGRAYFLQRKLSEELTAETEQAVRDLAQAAYDHLGRWAVAGQVSPLARAARDANGETEILRAAFLVRRASREAFFGAIYSFSQSHAGVRCEYTGPWPPYSFAVLTDEEAP
jgi:hypothetical protein